MRIEGVLERADCLLTEPVLARSLGQRRTMARACRRRFARCRSRLEMHRRASDPGWKPRATGYALLTGRSTASSLTIGEFPRVPHSPELTRFRPDERYRSCRKSAQSRRPPSHFSAAGRSSSPAGGAREQEQTGSSAASRSPRGDDLVSTPSGRDPRCPPCTRPSRPPATSSCAGGPEATSGRGVPAAQRATAPEVVFELIESPYNRKRLHPTLAARASPSS